MQINCSSTDWQKPIITLPLNQAFPSFQEMMDSLGEQAPVEFRTFSEKKVILTEDREHLFSVVGKKASVIWHVDALEMVGGALTELYGEEPVADLLSLKDGAGINVRFDLSKWVPSITPVVGDSSSPYLLLSNSYNSILPFKIRMGLYRYACANGCVVGDTIASISARSLNREWTVEGVAGKIKYMLGKLENVSKIWQHWAETEVEYETVMPLLEKKFSERFLDTVLSEDAFPQTVYDFYQSMTREATHGNYSDRSQLAFNNMIARIFYSKKSPFYYEVPNEEVEEKEVEGELVEGD